MEAPDRGWSWIVAVACFFINMLLLGTVRISSLLFVATVQSLQLSRKEASLPFSLASALKCFLGPFIGFLADRFGVRLIVLTGGIFGAVGIGMCVFTHDIILMTVFWGVLFGLGFGMGTQLLPAIINQYFDKYRARAIGISFSGSCLGSFLLPLLVEFCLREYELSGTFLILSGVVLNCVPLALLLRKPSFVEKNALPRCAPSLFTIEQASQNNCNFQNADTSCREINMEAVCTTVRENMKENDSSISATDLKVQCSETELSCLAEHGSLRKKSENGILYEAYLQKYGTAEDNNVVTIHKNVNFHKCIKEKSGSINLNNVIKPNAFESETRSVHNSVNKNMTLFRTPMFILIGLNKTFYLYTLCSTMTVLADFAVDIGVEIPKLPYILMSLSLGDFFGRSGLGSLIDKGFMTVMQYTATFFALQALFIASFAWATGFWYLVTISFVYGVCEAALMLSSPLLIVECIDTKLQTVAMPSIDVFSGFTFLTIPKLIELFRDQIGSYVGLFYTMSAISLICSATWFIVPFFMKRRS